MSDTNAAAKIPPEPYFGAFLNGLVISKFESAPSPSSSPTHVLTIRLSRDSVVIGEVGVPVTSNEFNSTLVGDVFIFGKMADYVLSADSINPKYVLTGQSYRT